MITLVKFCEISFPSNNSEINELIEGAYPFNENHSETILIEDNSSINQNTNQFPFINDLFVNNCDNYCVVQKENDNQNNAFNGTSLKKSLRLNFECNILDNFANSKQILKLEKGDSRYSENQNFSFLTYIKKTSSSSTLNSTNYDRCNVKNLFRLKKCFRKNEILKNNQLITFKINNSLKLKEQNLLKQKCNFLFKFSGH